MTLLKLLAGITIFVTSVSVQATIEIGVGSTSATGGRIVPALAGGYMGSQYGLFASSTGVANHYYYQNNYQFSFYWLLKGGPMWGGTLSPGFGVGTMLAIRSFQDEGSTTEDKSDDIALGPALRLNWSFFDTMYIGLDTMWGVRNLSSLASLSFQDYAGLSIGAALW